MPGSCVGSKVYPLSSVVSKHRSQILMQLMPPLATCSKRVRLSASSLILLTLLAAHQSQAVPSESILASDIASPFSGLLSPHPGEGQAQQFTITSGNWLITRARLILGSQDPMYPVTPALQVRDTSGVGGGPGAVLGSFSINPNDLPRWQPTRTDFSTVTAPAASDFTLNAGTYWLCLIHTGSAGAFDDALTSANPLMQSGIAGSVIMGDGVLRSYDGGLTFTADLAGSALLMELDGTAVPEPTTLTLFSVLSGLTLLASPRRSRAG